MQDKDYILRVIESIFKFIRKLLKLDYTQDSKEFIQESKTFFKNNLNFDIDNPDEGILLNLQKEIKDDTDFKKLEILILRLCIAYSSIDYNTGKDLFVAFKNSLKNRDRTFYFHKTIDDTEIEKLLKLNKDLYE